MVKQQQQNNSAALGSAILCGLTTLSDPDIRVPGKDIEALANFKGILRSLISGELVLATPDRLLPEDMNLPVQEVEKDKKSKD